MERNAIGRSLSSIGDKGVLVLADQRYTASGTISTGLNLPYVYFQSIKEQNAAIDRSWSSVFRIMSSNESYTKLLPIRRGRFIPT